MLDLIVFGCGSQALYVVENRRAAGLPAPVAMVDLESGSMVGAAVAGVPIRWNLNDGIGQLDPAGHEVIVAHGDNRRKIEVATLLERFGVRFASAVHPGAMVSPLAILGSGCIVNAGAVVMPQARLGSHVVLHAMSVVEHDCVLEDGANLAPGATLAGRVTVGRGAYVYTGAVVVPKCRIGAFAVVGAGAVVLRDVAEGTTVVGNPARPLAGKGNPA